MDKFLGLPFSRMFMYGEQNNWGMDRKLGLHNRSGRRRVRPGVVRFCFAGGPVR